ncbi:hypothetical protein [Haloarcula salinisoli]|uniref:Uncharacterized protein n=1 Tax=Haloarcula salinisoli TaxID=2487746 RepID=A0A8J7YHS6_9EURY|nr:hypothetical protein [Halomicroarcula salinisoli]MBX0288581.1 hypothetical protein [Halomicroarcula salinisoli]MBX0305747.1 hypothetical protein [Halomicroarcula salinisoli]
MCEAEPRFFIEVRGVSPSDFSANAQTPEKRDEAVALANDVHDLLREGYGKTEVTGVVPVVNPEVHERLVDR